MSDFSKEEQAKFGREVSIRIGQNIRVLRESKGITQTELANRIYSDRQYLYKIEKAKVGISIIKLAIIAKALDVPMEELVKMD